MDYFEAIKSLANDQDMTLGAIGEQAGRKRTFISTYTTRGRVPSLTVARELAAPLGYGLALVPLDAAPDALDVIGAIPLDAAPREQ